MPFKTPRILLNKFRHGEPYQSDHPDPGKRQAPEDSLNHNFDLIDQLLRSALVVTADPTEYRQGDYWVNTTNSSFTVAYTDSDAATPETKAFVLGGEVDWATLLNKPATFPPSAHTHVRAAITDFAHTHPQAEITGLVTDLAAKAPLASPNFTGLLTAADAARGSALALGTTGTKLATADFVHAFLGIKTAAALPSTYPWGESQANSDVGGGFPENYGLITTYNYGAAPEALWQLYHGNSGRVYKRQRLTTDAWGGWRQINGEASGNQPTWPSIVRINDAAATISSTNNFVMGSSGDLVGLMHWAYVVPQSAGYTTYGVIAPTGWKVVSGAGGAMDGGGPLPNVQAVIDSGVQNQARCRVFVGASTNLYVYLSVLYARAS